MSALGPMPPRLVSRLTGKDLDADSVPGLAEIAATHDLELAALRQALEAYAQPPPPSSQLGEFQPTPGEALRRPVVWHTLDKATAARLWRSLGEWVGWLRGRYPIAQRLPACWWRHPELVEETTALWAAWREAHLDPEAPLSASADWHARWLPDYLRRLGAGGWNLPCETTHRPVITGQYDPRGADDPGAYAAAVPHRPHSVADDPDAPALPGLDAAALTQPHDTSTGKETLMDTATMRRHLEAGRAIMLGGLPGSPVALDDDYWAPAGEGWERIDSPETIAYLRGVRGRLALADQAVERATAGDPDHRPTDHGDGKDSAS